MSMILGFSKIGNSEKSSRSMMEGEPCVFCTRPTSTGGWYAKSNPAARFDFHFAHKAEPQW